MPYNQLLKVAKIVIRMKIVSRLHGVTPLYRNGCGVQAGACTMGSFLEGLPMGH